MGETEERVSSLHSCGWRSPRSSLLVSTLRYPTFGVSQERCCGWFAFSKHDLVMPIARVTPHLRVASVASTRVINKAALTMRSPVCGAATFPTFSLASCLLALPPTLLPVLLSLVCLAGPSSIVGCGFEVRTPTRQKGIRVKCQCIVRLVTLVFALSCVCGLPHKV